MKTVSIMIPTRGRPDGVLRTIESIRNTTSPERVEIILRGDDDDPSFTDLEDKYDAEPGWENVYFITGPRFEGYKSLDKFYEECSAMAIGAWLMMFNDDTLTEGKAWDEELSKIPTNGFLCHAAVNYLNASRYVTGPGPDPYSPFPIVPNRFWKALGHDRIENQVDIWFCKIANKAGWQHINLARLTVRHNRQNK